MINVIDWAIAAAVDTPEKESAQRWWGAFLGGSETASGERVTPEKAMALSAYFACVRNISEDVGKLPLKVYRRLHPRGKQGLPDHSLYGLLHDAPNPDMTAIAFRETLTHHALGWGGGFAEIERDNAGRPIAFWVIHPSRVKIKRNKAREIVYEVHSEDLGVREPVTIAARNMLHIHGLGAAGISGYVVSVVGKEAIGVGLAAQRFGGRFFGNSTRPSGVLRHPQTLSKDGHENLRKSWSEMHSRENALKPAILEEGMEWQPMFIPPEEAQFLQTRQHEVEDVARWFRMPPHKIQHLLRATFSNIESQAIEYVGDTLMPWLVRWEQEIKRKCFDLESEADLFAEHLVGGLLRGDSQKRANYYRQMWNIGVYSQNDIREMENENPSENGDTYYVPRNMMPVEEALAGGGNQPPPANAPANGNGRAQIVKAHYPLLQEAAARVITKETKALSRAAGKFAGDLVAFEAWAEDFYQKHGAYYVEALMPPATAMCLLLEGPPRDTLKALLIDCTQAWIRACRVGMLDAFRRGRVDELCEQWQQTLPKVAAHNLIKVLVKEES